MTCPRQREVWKLWQVIAAGILGMLIDFPVGQAFDFGDMMNPGKWMGGNDRDRYDNYHEGPYPGFRGNPYGGRPYGRGGWPGPEHYYGHAPFPGNRVSPPIPHHPGASRWAMPQAAPPAMRAAPAQPSAKPRTAHRTTQADEIEQLKRRIEELEVRHQQSLSKQPNGAGTDPRPAAQDAAELTPTRPDFSGDEWGSAPAFRPLGDN